MNKETPRKSHTNPGSLISKLCYTTSSISKSSSSSSSVSGAILAEGPAIVEESGGGRPNCCAYDSWSDQVLVCGPDCKRAKLSSNASRKRCRPCAKRQCLPKSLWDNPKAASYVPWEPSSPNAFVPWRAWTACPEARSSECGQLVRIVQKQLSVFVSEKRQHKHQFGSGRLSKWEKDAG